MKYRELAELASFIFNPLGWKNICEHSPELAHHYETLNMPEWVSETITSDIMILLLVDLLALEDNSATHSHLQLCWVKVIEPL